MMKHLPGLYDVTTISQRFIGGKKNASIMVWNSRITTNNCAVCVKHSSLCSNSFTILRKPQISMAVLFLLLTILLIVPDLRLFSAAQSPASAPILPPPIANSTVSSVSTPPPSTPTFVPPPSSSPPIITITPPPPPPLSLPPTTTINPTPPPQQIQLNNIIDALIGAGDFAGWANILSNTNPSNLPVSATFFIPGNNALSHLPTSTASGAINFDPFIIPYHIIPQRLSFSDLVLFKTQTRLPTLLPTKSILITDNSPANFSVDNSPITHPDMYTNSAVTVHGIGTMLDYTIYGGNPFKPPVQQTQNPSPEGAGSRRSDSSTMFTGYQLFFSIICAVLAFKIEVGRFNMTKIALFLCGLCFAATAHGISLESCASTYDEGGAPAIFRSPKCTQWVLFIISRNATRKCDLATMQGYREYQEDRMTCILDIKIPSLGRDADRETKFDVLALFDGHGGAVASEMASQKFLDYFFAHAIFRTINEALLNVDQHDLINPESPPKVLSVSDDESIRNILKEALLHTIHDIDMEFSLEASNEHRYVGSTATVVLLLNDEEILVAHLGDSPALLCTASSTGELRAEKLTRDHHPDEEDERARIEAAGGYVQVLGVPRVNGRLAVSRAIGDIALKRYGVIAEPEVKGWQKLRRKDRYLVIASDGIFERYTPDRACNFIQEGGFPSSSLSVSIVKMAFITGSTDNLSVIVLPLRQPPRSQPRKDEL